MVAIVAAALFVVVLSADATMNRTYSVQVETPEGWREAGTTASNYEPYRVGSAEVSANRSDTLRFRLLADNGFLWPLDDTYRVYVNGIEVASGDIDAGARSVGEAEFTLTAERLLSQFGPASKEAPQFMYASFEVRVGNEVPVYVNVGIREVSQG